MANYNDHINDNEDLRLTPPLDRFPSPEKLKRSEMEGLDTSLWEELSIAVAENEQDILQNFSGLQDNEEFNRNVEEHKRCKLAANDLICYPNKSSLKKRSPKIGLWVGLAAAVVAILVALPIFNITHDSYTEEQQAIANANEAAKNAQKTVDPTDKDLLQPATVVAQTDKVETPSISHVGPMSKTRKDDIQPDALAQNSTRQSLNLQPIETGLSVEVTSTQKERKDLVQSGKQDVVMLASSENIKPIEVEKANFFDRLREKSIVNINKALGKGTIVTREYDSNGKLTLYAVQSNTLNFEKRYIE